MAKQSFFLAVVLAVLPFVACHGDNKDDNATNDKYDVYVTGEHSLWKNGVRQNLAAGRSIDGNSVFVSGQDVYVAGVDRTGSNNVAVLWKNGTVTNLGDAGNDSEADSVFVSGNNVYVAGHEYVNWDCYPRLWVNGERRTLGGDGSTGIARCVFVSEGGDVYVAGMMGDYYSSRAALWKDGVLQSLETSSYSDAVSVYVSNDNKVYVAGADDDHGALWVNGVAQRLNIFPVSVQASGTDVHIAGMANNGAVLWKNGTVQSLKSGKYPDTNVTGLFVIDGETFVSGYEGYWDDHMIPTLWVNGKAQYLAPETADIFANSVYVVEKGK